VFLLMVSVGMSLRHREVIANLHRMNWLRWIGLVLATFIVPAGLALLLGRILPLNLGEMAGLFLVGAAKTDIGKVAAAETGATREDNLRRLARELGATPTTEEEVRGGWTTQPRHLIATAEYAPGTRLEFTVRRQGQTVAICTATISENDASDIQYVLLQKP